MDQGRWLGCCLLIEGYMPMQQHPQPACQCTLHVQCTRITSMLGLSMTCKQAGLTGYKQGWAAVDQQAVIGQLCPGNTTTVHLLMHH